MSSVGTVVPASVGHPTSRPLLPQVTCANRPSYRGRLMLDTRASGLSLRARIGLGSICLLTSCGAALGAFRAATAGSAPPDDARAPVRAVATIAPIPWAPTALCSVEDCSHLAPVPSGAPPRGAARLQPAAPARPPEPKTSRAPGRDVRDDRVRWTCDAAGACAGSLVGRAASWTCDDDGRCTGDISGRARWRCSSDGSCRGHLVGDRAEWSCDDDGCVGVIADARSSWSCVDGVCAGSVAGKRSRWRCDASGACRGHGSRAIAALGWFGHA